MSIPDGGSLPPREGKSLTRRQTSRQSAYPIIIVQAAFSPDGKRIILAVDLPAYAVGLQQSPDEEIAREGFHLVQKIVPRALDVFLGVEYICPPQAREIRRSGCF